MSLVSGLVVNVSVASTSSISVARSTLKLGRNLPGFWKYSTSDFERATDLLSGRIPDDLPTPLDYAIKQAVFVKSSSQLQHLPGPVGPEFAFIGRSNAGKSSLVNLLTNIPNLAKVSSKPGKTRTINHFMINRKWMLVDCPGYGDSPGYESSKQDRIEWHELTKEYFLSRKTLAHVFLLIDASSPLSSDDIHASLWINDSGRPWSLVFTKLDAVELGRAHPLDNMEHCLETIERLTASTLSFIPTCSHTGLGKDGLLKYISGLRQAFKMPLVFK